MKRKNKYWIIPVLICSVLSLSAQDVKVSIDHPESVQAGEVFGITLTIKKGALSDYSRFSQDLPLGLTASNVSSPNADFSFDNQRIRIIWLKLPEGDALTVSYNIMVNEVLKGSFSLGGVFAYVVDDERKFLDVIQSDPIEIIPSPSMDAASVIDIKDYKGPATLAAISGSQDQQLFAMAIRQKPVLLGSGGYLIKLLVKNPEGSKYAKIEESIPSGYLFESIDPHDGIESFSSSVVKFIWMKLPEEPEFELSYKLVPKRDEPQGAMAIKGQFTYSSGSENKVVDIMEMDLALNEMSVSEKRTLLESGTTPAGAVTAQAAATTEPVVEKKPEPEPEPEPEKVTEVKSVPAGASSSVIENTRVLAKGSGVYFRVQLTANRNPFDAKSHFRAAGVDQEVFVEKHEGLYKYTAGSFTSYSQALNYRDRVEGQPEVEGAFVVAYRDGRRVNVASVQ